MCFGVVSERFSRTVLNVYNIFLYICWCILIVVGVIFIIASTSKNGTTLTQGIYTLICFIALCANHLLVNDLIDMEDRLTRLENVSSDMRV